MMSIKDQMRVFIWRGLYRDNLLALLPLARQLFHQRPVLYGSLIFIFRSLEDEYADVQGVPTERCADIQKILEQPLV